MTDPLAADVKQLVEDLLRQLEKQENEGGTTLNGIHYVEICEGEPSGFDSGWTVKFERTTRF